MIMVISTNLPHRVRGVLKIWLLEVKAGVFCGNINAKIEGRIFKFLMNYMNTKYELLIIRNDDTSPQGFTINTCNSNNIKNISGLQFISN